MQGELTRLFGGFAEDVLVHHSADEVGALSIRCRMGEKYPQVIQHHRPRSVRAADAEAKAKLSKQRLTH
jgi:hypothetical protein